MPDITYRWQYCQGDYDITDQFHAGQDADMVRAWEGDHGDFCLLELTRQDGGWVPTGGDGDWTPLADTVFTTPEEGITAYLANEGN